MEKSHQIIWHEDTVPPATLKALRFCAKQDWLHQSAWYLAGGTALALYVGHRQSQDLDFFIADNTFDTAVLLRHFEGTPWKTDILREATVYGSLFGAKVSFIAYPFFVPKETPNWFGAVRVLAPRDIAVMKMTAISQRGKKRDFIDLYWYTKNREPLIDILLRLPAQYPTVTHDYHHILKSITYFKDADEDVMPQLNFKVTWKEVKRYFEREAPLVSKTLMELSN